jgi:hypothetical protein
MKFQIGDARISFSVTTIKCPPPRLRVEATSPLPSRIIVKGKHGRDRHSGSSALEYGLLGLRGIGLLANAISPRAWSSVADHQKVFRPAFAQAGLKLRHLIPLWRDVSQNGCFVMMTQPFEGEGKGKSIYPGCEQGKTGRASQNRALTLPRGMS